MNKEIQNAHLHGQPSEDGTFSALPDTNDEIAQSVRIPLRVQEGCGSLSTSHCCYWNITCVNEQQDAKYIAQRWNWRENKKSKFTLHMGLCKRPILLVFVLTSIVALSLVTMPLAAKMPSK